MLNLHPMLLSIALLVSVSALPANRSLSAPAGKLGTRAITYHPSCFRQNYYNPVELYANKIDRAIADVRTLVQHVLSGTVLPSGITYRTSTAFLDYFRDEEYDTVIGMMRVVLNFNDYPITFECGDDQMDLAAGCGDRTIALKRTERPDATFLLCDRFFDVEDEETNKELSFRDGSAQGWCQEKKMNNFRFFDVSALTILHELTHSDAIGRSANLFPGGSYHATWDIEHFGPEADRSHFKRDGYPMEYHDAARQLEFLWNLYDLDDGPNPTAYKPLLRTYENAESYAASAVQWYFEALCHFSIETNWRSPGF